MCESASRALYAYSLAAAAAAYPANKLVVRGNRQFMVFRQHTHPPILFLPLIPENTTIDPLVGLEGLHKGENEKRKALTGPSFSFTPSPTPIDVLSERLFLDLIAIHW